MDYRKNPKGYVKPKKPDAAVNLVADNSPKESAVNDTSSAPIFTQEQYAEIMKLLGKQSMHYSNQPTANMAGNEHPLTLCSDWIVDTSANEHMTGCESLL